MNDTEKESINIWLHGSSGKMGQELSHLIEGSKHTHLIGGSSQSRPIKDCRDLITNCNVLIDFSNLDGHESLIAASKDQEIIPENLLICTTGIEQKHINYWKEYSKKNNTKILIAANTSLGVSLMLKSALAIAGFCSKNHFDIEIEESHHRYKKDSPSGTALMLGEAIAKKTNKNLVTDHREIRNHEAIGIHSIRGGGIFGEHKIRFISDHEEVCLTHRAFSRGLFASGALALARWLQNKNSTGLFFTQDIEFESNESSP